MVLGIAAGSLVVLYFVATSGAFIKAVVLPRVADALKSDLSVGDISVSPFSSVTLSDVKLTPKGAEPLATVKRVHARYSLMSIIRGTIAVDEATVEGAEVNLVEAKDGTSNLSRLIDSLGGDNKPKEKSAPPKLAVRNVALKDAALRYRTAVAASGVQSVEVTGLNLTLDQLVNNQPGKLAIAGDLRAKGVGKPPGDLAVRLGGNLDVTVDDALLPSLVKGGLKADLSQGTGPFQSYAGLGTALDVDLTGKEVRDLVLRFAQGGQELARIGVRGPFDLAKKELRLSYEVKGLDRRVLALAGAASGIDLGDTTVGATGRVDVANGGNLVASNGRLTVARLSLGGQGTRTPVVDVAADYKASANLSDKTALVDKLDLLVKQGNADLVKGTLDRSMNLAWDKPMAGFQESTYSVVLAGLDLAQWRAVLPTNAPSGLVRADVRVTAEKSGQVVRLALNAGVDNLAASVGGNRIQDGAATLKLTGSATEFNSFNADSLALEVRRGRDVLLSVTGLGDWRTKNGQGGVQLNVEGQLAPLLSIVPVAGIDLKSGTVKVSGQLAKRATDVGANLSVSVARLTGSVGSIQLADYQANAEFAVTASGPKDDPFNEVDIQRASLSAQTGFNAGGSLDLHGKYNVARKAGSFDFKSVNLNESALGPFVAPAIAPNRLLSVALDLNGKAEVNLASKSSAQLDLKLSNLRAEDPAHRLPTVPLAAGLGLDVSVEGLVSDIRRLELDLGATDRAKNRLALSGHVDLSTNKPTPSTVSIRSEGLDLTRYYDLFAGGSTNAPAAQPAPTARKSDPNVEPPAVVLPIRDLTGDVDIAAVYLREVEAKAIKGRVVVKDGRVALDPFGLTLNGAAVTAKVNANLGVPGYEYDVNFGASSVPIAPLADSFVADLKGLAQGTAIANISLKGAGVTGPNLRRNLGGLVLVVATNAQIRIPDKPIRLPGFLTWMPIFPYEINPGTVLALIGKKSVLAEPIRTVQARVDIAQGVAKVSETRVASPAILAEVAGSVALNDVLTNSTLKLPVAVAIGGNGPLPAARTIGTAVGTIGSPKFDKDLVALASIGLSVIPGGGALGEKATGAIRGAAGQLNERTGGALGAAANLLGGGGASTNTNAAPANLIGGALNLLGGGKGKTNAPAANTNKPANPLDAFPNPFKRK